MSDAHASGDHQRLALLRAGDADAWRELAREMLPQLYRFALSLTGDPAASEDVTQQALVRVYKARMGLREGGTLRAYCYRAALNLVAEGARSDARRRRHESASSEERMRTATPEPGPEQAALAREAWEEAARLPLQLANVLRLRFGHGLSLAETAHALALPEGTVSTHQREALDELRRRLGERRGALPALGAAGMGMGTSGEILPAAARADVLANALTALPDPSLGSTLPSTLAMNRMEAVIMASIGGKSLKVAVAVCLALLLTGGAAFFGWRAFGAERRLAPNGDVVADNTQDKIPRARNASLGEGAIGTPSTVTSNRPDAPAAPVHANAENGTAGTQALPGSSGTQTPPGGAATPEQPPAADEKFSGDAVVRVDLSDITVTFSGAVKGDGNIANLPVQVYQQLGDANPRFLRATGADLSGDAIWKASAPRMAETSTDAEGRFQCSFKLPSYVLFEVRDRTNRELLDIESGEGRVPYLRFYVSAMRDDEPAGVTAAGFRLETGTVEYRKEGLVIELPVDFNVVCRVQDEDGWPIQGATCWWVKPWEFVRDMSGRPVSAISDRDGIARFRLGVLEDADGAATTILLHQHGSGCVMARADGFAQAKSESLRIYNPEPGRIYDTSITMRPGRDFRLAVQDALGNPVQAGIYAAARNIGRASREEVPADGDQSLLGSMLDDLATDMRGIVLLRNLPRLRFTLSILVSGYDRAEILVPADATEGTIILQRKNVVVVKFIDATSKVPLNAFRFELSSATFQRMGGCRGTFVQEMAEGDYRLRVWFEGIAHPSEFTFHVDQGESQEKTFEVSTSGICVTGIVRTEDIVAVAGAEVSLEWVSPPEDVDYDSITASKTITAADGTFRFDGVQPGSYVIRVRHENYSETARPVEVAQSLSGTLGFEFTLAFGGTLIVTVPEIPDGEKCEYHPLVVTGGANFNEISHHSATREGRQFTFTELPLGRLSVVLESSAYKQLPFDGDPYAHVFESRSGQTETFSFEAGPVISVSGVALDDAGKPAAERKLMFFRVAPDMPVDDVPPSGYSWKKLLTNSEGRFVAHGLLPGRYVWVDHYQRRVEFTVEAGKPDQEVVLTLRK